MIFLWVIFFLLFMSAITDYFSCTTNYSFAYHRWYAYHKLRTTVVCCCLCMKSESEGCVCLYLKICGSCVSVVYFENINVLVRYIFLIIIIVIILFEKFIYNNWIFKIIHDEIIYILTSIVILRANTNIKS